MASWCPSRTKMPSRTASRSSFQSPPCALKWVSVGEASSSRISRSIASTAGSPESSGPRRGMREPRVTWEQSRLEQTDTSVNESEVQRAITMSLEHVQAGEWTGPLAQAFTYGSRLRWHGWDPYDGLRSPLAGLPILRSSRTFRLGWIQLVKRS